MNKWQQYWLEHNPYEETLTQVCGKCLIEKDSKAFGISRKKKTGLIGNCKECEESIRKTSEHKIKKYNYDRKRYKEKRVELIAQVSKYHKEHEEETRLNKFKWDLKVTFSITYEAYCQMFENQNGLCKICKTLILKGPIKGTKKDTCHVDHDHNTGEVRGLLCRLCNNGLGNFRDSIDFLSKAIEYLRREI